MASPLRPISAGVPPVSTRPISTMMRSLAVPKSGLAAYSKAAAIIAENIANMETTNTPEGGPYKRQVVTFRRVTDDQGVLGGVVVADVVRDPGPGRLVHNPAHPDADAQGYVRMPNVDVTQELADMMLVRRLHEANATAFQAGKSMLRAAIGIGR